MNEAFSWLAGEPAALYTVAGLLGLVVGSFLNVVIYRLPVMLKRSWQAECAELAGGEAVPAPAAERFDLVVPRSRCPHCGHPISAWENVPLLSFLWLRGRCRACKTRIPLRYPLVEALTALLSVAVAWRFGQYYNAELVPAWKFPALARFSAMPIPPPLVCT